MIRSAKIRPLISVVIPTYNEQYSIRKCLNHLLSQDFSKPYEVIVVDGPSQDKTYDIAKKMGARVFKINERGISLAWQKGSEKSRSEIIAFTEADTLVPKNWISEIYQNFQINRSAVGLVGQYRFKNNTKLNYLIAIIMFLVDKIHEIWKGHYAFRGTNFAVRKEYLKICGGFNVNIKTHGDVELSSRIKNFGEIIYLPNLIVSTTNRHVKSPGNFINFLIRAGRAIYYINVIGKPEKINKMYDIR